MESKTEFAIRQMNLADLEMAVDWAAQEGWNPGLSDAKVFYDCDPGGFMVGELGGRPIASISAVTYSNGVAFLGFFMVIPEMRGKGYGRKIWLKALERLGGRIIGLDGVVAQQANYQRDGFVYAYPSYRYQSSGGGEAPQGLVPLDQAPWPQVAALDEACFFSPRGDFLASWTTQPGVRALAELQGGSLRGFGVLRPCREGYKIGPLFAKEPGAALRLFQGLLAQAPDEKIYLDAPANNPRAMKLAKDQGLSEVFETARMYKNGEPQFRHDWVYGVTSFELG
jgi:GNAT superfamily N-acetyltransferase